MDEKSISLQTAQDIPTLYQQCQDSSYLVGCICVYLKKKKKKGGAEGNNPYDCNLPDS